MDIAVIDQRRYGRQTRYYVLRASVESCGVLPDGLYLGLDDKSNEAILGEPSLVNWREVKREDFVSESMAAYLERSK